MQSNLRSPSTWGIKVFGHKAVPCIFKLGVSRMKRGQNEPVQVKCTLCGKRAIVSLPVEDLPACQNSDCYGRRMVIEELLDEGKSF